MSFVIAKKNMPQLETPVFAAGSDGDQEAVAVFTNEQAAQTYIDDAGWTDQYEVGRLIPVQLARWLVEANEQGTEMLVVNPNRQQHLDGQEQRVIFLSEPLAAFADLLESEIHRQDVSPATVRA